MFKIDVCLIRPTVLSIAYFHCLWGLFYIRSFALHTAQYGCYLTEGTCKNTGGIIFASHESYCVRPSCQCSAPSSQEVRSLFLWVSLFLGLSWPHSRACEHLASLCMLNLVLTEINLASSTVHSSVIKEYIF